MIVQLSDFDLDIIHVWRITPADLARVRQYIAKLQGHLPRTTWDDIEVGGVYGTSALLHEVVELRILLGRDPHLLRRSSVDIRAFLSRNQEAHLRGLTEEYLYLQRQIRYRFRVWCDVGALVKANTPQAWDSLFGTDLLFVEPTPQAVAEAAAWLDRLKEVSQ